MFSGTFFGQSNVLRLIIVFVVADLPIYGFFYHMFRFAKIYATCCVYIYLIYIYIYIYIYILDIYELYRWFLEVTYSGGWQPK